MSEYIFGEFAPDAAKDNANVLTECLNMRYDVGGYMNIKGDLLTTGQSGVIISYADGDVDNSDYSTVRIQYRDDGGFSGGAHYLLFGTDGASSVTLYRTGPLVKEYQTLVFGKTSFFVSRSGEIKYFNDSVSVWTDVTGLTGANAPKTMGVIGDFLFVGNFQDSSNSIKWSDVNDPLDFASGLSDNQLFPTGGAVLCIISADVPSDVGGETGYIFQERAIRRASPTGETTFIFQFNPITESLGIIGHGAACSLGGVVYFISDNCIYSINNRTLTPIGEGRVNKYFFGKIGAGNEIYCRAFANPVNGNIYFLGKSAAIDLQDPYFDVCVIYNPLTNKWDERQDAVGYPYSKLDINGTKQSEYSLKNPPASGVFPGNYSLSYQIERGANPVEYSCIATSPMRSKLGGRVLVNSVYPNVNSNPNQTFLRYAATNKIGDTRTYSAQKTLNSDNKFPIRASGKDVSIKLEFTSSDATPNPVTNCSGIDVDVVQIGQR